MIKIKRLISVILTSLILLSVFPAGSLNVLADEAYKLDIYFNVNGGTVTADRFDVDADKNVIYKSNKNNVVLTMTYDNPVNNGLWNASSFGLTKSGYTFAGWSTKDDPDTVFDQDDSTLKPSQICPDVANGDTSVVLYAVWKPFFTVKYRANGGIGYMPDEHVVRNTMFTLDDNAFTREGYTFVGWAANRESDNKWFVADVGWVTQSVINSKGYDKKIYKNKLSITLNNSWYNSSTGDNGDAIIFYAVWEVNKIDIHFSADGAAVTASRFTTDSDSTVIYKTNGQKVTLTMTYDNPVNNGLWNASSFGLEKPGYKFVGWTAKDGTDKVFDQDDSTLKPSEIYPEIKNTSAEITLYPVWESNDFFIEYNSNKATGAMSGTKVQRGDVITLSENKFVRDGYLFAGWNVYSEDADKWYVDGAGWVTEEEISSEGYEKKLYSNADTVSFDSEWCDPVLVNEGDTLVFYAVWDLEDYSITPAKNGVVIDSENGFIYGLAEGIWSLEKYINCKNCSLRYTETEMGFGTGTRVDVIVEGRAKESYEIVIFGDVIGDGYVDVFDVADITSVINWEKEYEAGSAFEKAADVNRDGVIDESDLFLMDAAAGFIEVLPQA